MSNNNNGEADHVIVELVSSNNNTNINDVAASSSSLSDEIAPLLTQNDKPQINLFTLSYSRRKPKDQVTKFVETEVSGIGQFMSWVWSGSKYSGLLCMALSCTIYSIMEAISHVFPVHSIPIFESILARCTIVMILSFVWLRKTGQTVFGPSHVRSLLVSRALVGYLSLFSFIYSVQNLPLSQALVLNFMTPIMASMAARVILQEKTKLAEIGGQICSFMGLLLILRSMLIKQGGLAEKGDPNKSHFTSGIHHIYAILVGLFSSITGGISYCFIRAGAKASDQPVVTLFAFSLLASPAAAICTFIFQNFVLPDIYSFLDMVVLSVMAFFAEILLAHGLQLEKTSRVVNLHYIEPLLSEIWGIGLSRVKPSFGGLFGCLLILASVCSTMYFGPEKEVE